MGERDVGEFLQMCDAPSDAYSAGEWCEAAGALAARLAAVETDLAEALARAEGRRPRESARRPRSRGRATGDGHVSFNGREDSGDMLFAGFLHDEEGLEYHHPDRINQDVAEALASHHIWLRAGYSCALHCVYLMGLLEANGIEFDGTPTQVAALA